MKENLKPCAYKLWKCYERCSESVFDEADDPLARSDASEKSDASTSGVALATQLVRAPLPHEETEAKRGFRMKPVRVRKGALSKHTEPPEPVRVRKGALSKHTEPRKLILSSAYA